jgi:carboxymethylenebutenolidase
MMDAYLVNPKSSPRGGVLVLHAWWGLNQFFKDLCNRLAAEGLVVLAPDLYHGRIATTIPEADKLSSNLTRAQASADILQALETLQSQPGIEKKPIGLIGFSLGANLALWLVDEKPDALAATVLFYGTRGGKYEKTSSAFLGHFAETDEYGSESGKKKLVKTLKATGKEVTFHTYPGTGHWFFENDRDAYNQPAADLAWQRTTEFLHAHLG